MRWECERISDPWLDEMPTSIVQIYTPEGFVVAADGREYDMESEKTLAENVRKIFAVNERGRALLWSLSGTNKLTLRESAKPELDLLPLIHEAVSKLANISLRSLWHYADALSRSVEYLPEHDEEKESTIIYLDGYYDGRPKRAKIKVYYNGDHSPQVSSEEIVPGKIEGCGSNKILDALKLDLESAGNYRTPLWKLDQSERTLAHAIELAKSYIGAQCDDEVREIDPKWFNAIGGFGHLCILSSNGNFEWIFRNPATQEWASFQPTGSTVP